ncbi:hypothetical protein K501DRAFT_233819 [Backusella circina FSU 941]|nr:hypothetical protein K501DRAFT_233819 [Backusella circina FSU 941]
MILNVFTMLPAAIFCAIISYFCTLYNQHLANGLYSNGAGVIAAISFFLCVFVIAYYRLKYPRLFIPALQGFTLPFFGLTKGIYNTQFDIMSIVGILYPVLIGGGIALVVNLALWPETAAKLSETSFGNALASIQDVLDFTRDEILQNNGDLSVTRRLRQLIEKLDNDTSKMQVARKEAKYELVISHYNPRYYKSFANTMSGLSRNLYGFALAIEREAQILLAQKVESQLTRHRTQQSQQLRMRNQQIEEGDTLMTQGSGYIGLAKGTMTTRIEYKVISRLHSSVKPEIIHFIEKCGLALASTRARLEKNKAIPHSKTPMTTTDEPVQEMMEQARASLREARLSLQREYEERRAEPTEDHYLIYTVLFSLSRFGEKIILLDKQADDLIAKKRGNRFPRLFFPHVNFRKWLLKAGESASSERTATEQVIFEQQSLQREETSHEGTSSAEEEKKNRSSDIDSSVRLYDISSVTPLQNVAGDHFWNSWFLAINDWLRQGPTRYAIKFAIATELLALMAWLPIEGVNELYNNNHGQWALLSCMVVFNFTVGSTALQCLFRVLATIIGAIAGYIALLAARRNENPYVLAVMILIFQIPMWYTLLGSKYPRIGFISILTMAVITSTGYSDKYQEDLFAPVWKRTLTAIFAILVVLIVDLLIWPVWARCRMRKHLSALLIDTGIHYSKVASLVCQENTASYLYKSTLEDTEAESKHLRRQLDLVRQMLNLAEMEPRLTKGRFPIEVYRQILEHEQHILYWIEHLRKVQAFVNSEIRRLIMNPMNPYRKEMAAAVHLYLFTLACSLRTKSSLPASLPSAEIARQILQKRQAMLWHDTYSGLSTNDKDPENQIYWQTYAAGSVEVIFEQEQMGDLVAKLMGQHVFKTATKDWIV